MLSARATGQLIVLTTVAAFAVISLLKGWYITAMVMLALLVFMVI